MTTELVPIETIRVDGSTQLRAAMSADLIASLAEAIEREEVIPPVVLFEDTNDLKWPGDGLHRIAAYRKVGKKFVPAEVHKGTKRDAVLFAAGANAAHDTAGLRRTREDKVKAVETLLKDKEWGSASTSWLAEKCNVSQGLVERLRRGTGSHSGTSTGQEPPESTKRTGQDGKKYGASKRDAPKPVDEDDNELDTSPGARKRQEESKNGAEVVDWWKRWESIIGPIVRYQEDFCRAHPDEKATSNYYAFERMVKELYNGVKAWCKKVKEKKGKK